MTVYRTSASPALVRLPMWRRLQHRLAHLLRVHACHIEHRVDYGSTGEPHEWIWVVCDTCDAGRQLAHSAACECRGPSNYRNVSFLDSVDKPSIVEGWP
jgi:hypothetical protein